MRQYACPASYGQLQFPDATFKLADFFGAWSSAKAGDPIGVELNYSPSSQQPYDILVIIATGDGGGHGTTTRLEQVDPAVAAKISPVMVCLMKDSHPVHSEVMKAAATVPDTDEEDFVCILTAGAGLVTLDRNDVFQHAIDTYEDRDINLGEYLHIIIEQADSAHQKLAHLKQADDLLTWMSKYETSSMQDNTPIELVVDGVDLIKISAL
jgi:hypothetical protein